MALSVETTLTTTWVEVVDTLITDYAIQNIGNNDVSLFWKATTPVATDVGFRIRVGQSVNSNDHLTGDIWARAATGVSKIVVNS